MSNQLDFPSSKSSIFDLIKVMPPSKEIHPQSQQ